MKTEMLDASGQKLISIGKMAKKAHLSASAIRGYEHLGLLFKYDVAVIRVGTIRFFKEDDWWKLSQIKIDRTSRRNQILSSQGINQGVNRGRY